MARPLGVTIIAILLIISGIVMIIGGAGAVAVAPFLPPLTQTEGMMIDSMSGALLSVTAIISGIILLALGIAALFIAYGLIKARGWAWTAAVVLSIVVVIMSVVSIVTGNIGSIISLAINGVILYYLYRRHVKEYFGKAVPSTPADTSAA
jgi:uncharacterized membrane protein (DUF2068 family)